MKKNDFIDIKGLDKKSLVKKAHDLKKEISELVLDKNMNRLSNVKSIDRKKYDLAQVLTVLRQKELLGMLESDKVSADNGKNKKGARK